VWVVGEEEEETGMFALQRDVCVLDDFKDLICSLSDFPYAGKFKELIVGKSLDQANPTR
jgi:hypothetical protein